jgi:hypothetical protein
VTTTARKYFQHGYLRLSSVSGYCMTLLVDMWVFGVEAGAVEAFGSRRISPRPSASIKTA